MALSVDGLGRMGVEMAGYDPVRFAATLYGPVDQGYEFNVGLALQARFDRHGIVSDLDEAIDIGRGLAAAAVNGS